MSERELKPCPFCGGEAELRTMRAGQALGYGAWAQCVSCGATGRTKQAGSRGVARRAALAAWNRRTPTPDSAVHP